MQAKQYKFTVADIAGAGNTSKHAVYRAIASGQLDPKSLASIVDWVSLRMGRKL